MKKIIYGFTDEEILSMDFGKLRHKILDKSKKLPEEILGDILMGKQSETDEKTLLCYSRMTAAMLQMDDVLIDT